jgi:hypothetical protein
MPLTADQINEAFASFDSDKRKGNGQAGAAQIRVKSFEHIKISTEPNYRVKGVLPRVGLAVAYGPPKCGKSFFTYDLTMHVALGWPYRGRRVQQGTVVYCALEGGVGFANRVEAWRQRHLTDHHKPVPFHLIDVPVDLVADRDRLVQAIQTQVPEPPAIIVIDTLNRALVGDENKSDDMAKLIRASDLLRTTFNCLVILVHHCGIAGNRPRGHTSLAGADDVQIAVARDEDGLLTVTVEHMKDGDPAPPIGCRLDRVTVGTDSDGEPISSCVIAPAEIVQAVDRRKLSDAAKFALRQLQEVIAESGQVPHASNHIPAGIMACPVVEWREHYYRTHPADKPDTKLKAFVRACETLQERGIIGLWSDQVWITGHGQMPDKRTDVRPAT